MLKNGSIGPAVEKVQILLGVNADGVFGPGTEAKVKEWQSAHGLTPAGIIDDSTWQAMFASTVETSTLQPVIFKLQNLQGHIPDSIIQQIPEPQRLAWLALLEQKYRAMGELVVLREIRAYRQLMENLQARD
jgi:peptidoglycan hydrolase-like protein with peptidoglycan-binding domain